MRIQVGLVLAMVLLGSLPIGAGEGQDLYPLWDGKEPIASYARRAGLPATKDFNLGQGVRLEMVLVPAGCFVKGTPRPDLPELSPLIDQMFIGIYFCLAAAACLIIMCRFVVVWARQGRHRTQYSLARFMVMAVMGSIALLGGLHWSACARRISIVEDEYDAAMQRWNMAGMFDKSIGNALILRPFYIGKYEVTQEQYQVVVGWHTSEFLGHARPVDGASPLAVQHFCVAVLARERLTLRPPSNCEWEYACRAGTRTKFHTGDDAAALARAGWFRENSNKATHVVGQKEPNRWGLYDMHGNVSEWCGDVYEANGQCSYRFRNPRGGSCLDNDGCCRAASRIGFCSYPYDDNTKHRCLGFRVVMDVPSGGKATPSQESADRILAKIVVRRACDRVPTSRYWDYEVPWGKLEFEILDTGKTCIPFLIAEIDRTQRFDLIRLLRLFDSPSISKAITRWLRERRLTPFEKRMTELPSCRREERIAELLLEQPTEGVKREWERMMRFHRGEWVGPTRVLLHQAQPYADVKGVKKELLAFLNQRWLLENERMAEDWYRIVTEGVQNLNGPEVERGLHRLADLDSTAGWEAMARLWAENKGDYRKKILSRLDSASPSCARKILAVLYEVHAGGHIPELNAFIDCRRYRSGYEEVIRWAVQVREALLSGWKA